MLTRRSRPSALAETAASLSAFASTRRRAVCALSSSTSRSPATSTLSAVCSGSEGPCSLRLRSFFSFLAGASNLPRRKVTAGTCLWILSIATSLASSAHLIALPVENLYFMSSLCRKAVGVALSRLPACSAPIPEVTFSRLASSAPARESSLAPLCHRLLALSMTPASAELPVLAYSVRCLSTLSLRSRNCARIDEAFELEAPSHMGGSRRRREEVWTPTVCDGHRVIRDRSEYLVSFGGRG